MTITINPLVLKILGLAILVVFIVALLVLLYNKIRRWFKGLKYSGDQKSLIKAKLRQIEELLEQKNESGWKLAVMESDKLLDEVLKMRLFAGQTMGERLKMACYKYPALRQVWWAHKIRNKLAHETHYHLNRRLAKSAIKSFKKAFKTLGVL